MMNSMISVANSNDAELVDASLAGNREAFSRIVARYQSLVCSLAYNATGSLGQSEDLAQETFITAWKHLGHLRERHKLRTWLCGIARNRINNFLRREGREPVREAEPLETVAESHCPEPLPLEQAISNEEAAILWRSLERIPALYREPLILFYREHQSIEAVAQSLDLTEDTVKQRLSRGRKLLQEQVLAFVEGALARTNPGKAFTLAVVAALPALTLSAKAATLGAAAAKGSATAKAAGIMGLAAGICGTVLVFLGNYLGYRMGLDEARSDTERGFVKTFYRQITVGTAIIFAAYAGGVWWLSRQAAHTLYLPGMLLNGLIVIYLLTAFGFMLIAIPRRRKYYAQLRTKLGGEGAEKPAYEFRSAARLGGWPLVHIRIGDRFDLLHEPVRAWVAVGNYAVGRLFAFGGIAMAPFSIGFCAIGLLPFGGLAFGLVALGGVALGGWSFGGLALGWQALGCIAVGWEAAAGSLALAHDFAVGPLAQAAQANTDAASKLVSSGGFFRFAQAVLRQALWLNLLWVAPLFIQWRIVARKQKQTRDQGI